MSSINITKSNTWLYIPEGNPDNTCYLTCDGKEYVGGMENGARAIFYNEDLDGSDIVQGICNAEMVHAGIIARCDHCGVHAYKVEMSDVQDKLVCGDCDFELTFEGEEA